jgi:phage shock protein E
MQKTMQKKRWLPGLALAALLSTMAGCGAAGTAQDYSNVTVAELHTRMLQTGASPFLLVDVRTPAEYGAGHIRGALLLPVDTLAGRLAEIPKDRPVYVYCQAGARSSRAASLLTKHGYTQINNVQGGIAAWQQAGFEVVR